MEVLQLLAKKKAESNSIGHSGFKPVVKNGKGKRQFVNAKGNRIAKFNLKKGNSACISSNGHHFGESTFEEGSKVVLHQ